MMQSHKHVHHCRKAYGSMHAEVAVVEVILCANGQLQGETTDLHDSDAVTDQS